MLRTYFELVPFSGREAELSQLRKWRDTAPTETAVHLIHGRGGQGKTRLAMHLARMWADEGWATLQAYSHDNFNSLDAAELSSIEGSAGLLIIVDYAERWETTNLLSLLRNTVNPNGPAVRIVMLSRPAGTWWQTFLSRLSQSWRVGVCAADFAAGWREHRRLQPAWDKTLMRYGACRAGSPGSCAALVAGAAMRDGRDR